MGYMQCYQYYNKLHYVLPSLNELEVKSSAFPNVQVANFSFSHAPV